MSIIISDEKLVRQIEELAQQERREPEEVVAEAVRVYKESPRTTEGASFLLSIAGIGRSGQQDVAQRAEEILASEIDAKSGWTVKKAVLGEWSPEPTRNIGD